MPRGRKPQTPEQKRAKGETRPSRTELAMVVDFPKVSEVPKAPGWLTNPDALQLWDDLAGRLVAGGLMTVVDQYALAHLCQLHGEIVDEVQRRCKPTSADRTRLQGFFAEFGLTPASRSRVRATDAGNKGNKFTGNGKKEA